MKWSRQRPGLYTAGPYAVQCVDTGKSIWTASGPDFTAVAGSKTDAQAAAQRSAHARLIDISDAYTVVPVVGDRVETTTGVRKVTLHTHSPDQPCGGEATGCRSYQGHEQIITVMPDPTPDEQRRTWFNLPEGGPW